jgi:hypothetical protein
MGGAQATNTIEVEEVGMGEATPAPPSSSDWLCFVGWPGIVEALL